MLNLEGSHSKKNLFLDVNSNWVGDSHLRTDVTALKHPLDGSDGYSLRERNKVAFLIVFVDEIGHFTDVVVRGSQSLS